MTDKVIDKLAAIEAISQAVETGAGLSAVVRAAASALDASAAALDEHGSVLAIAAASPEDERLLLGGDAGTNSHPLRVADRIVGSLLIRGRKANIDAGLLRMIGTMMALEVERTLAPERADHQVATTLIGDIVTRRISEGDDIGARASEMGIDLSAGAAFVLARATPRQPVADDWRSRLLVVVERTARSVMPSAVSAQVERGHTIFGEVFVLLPTANGELTEKAAISIERELKATLTEFNSTVGFGRVASDPADLFRASQEALLATNVAEAQRDRDVLAFEETGAYRLLLSAMCEDPEELRSFYSETIEPLLAYDDQYETDLLQTVETFLEADGNVAGTAQRLFTHRHTVRYRLERVRDLTGLDCSSTDGRERLGLGLKAMRVLGIPIPHGPALEQGVQAGRVRHTEADR